MPWSRALKALLFVLGAYALFAPFRLVRLAGDEKVYIAQALEMLSHGTLVKQTLFHEAETFKGLFHIWEILLGYKVFGYSMWAVLWMNFLWLGVGLLLLCFGLAEKTTDSRKPVLKPVLSDVHFVIVMGLGFSVAVMSHLFVGQMEATLLGMTMAFSGLMLQFSKEKSLKTELALWVLAGVIGWVKSPIYSVFFALSILLYNFWSLGLKRMHYGRTVLMGVTGVLVGLLAYLPSLIWDRDNFVNHYLIREQFSKYDNGKSLWFIWGPFLMYGLPWTVFVFERVLRAGCVDLRRRILQFVRNPWVRSQIAIVLPWAIMFSLFRYKGQNYLLPLIVPFTVLGLSHLSTKEFLQLRISRYVWMGLGLAIGIGIQFLLLLIFGWRDALPTVLAVFLCTQLWVLGFALSTLNLKCMAVGSAGFVGVFLAIFVKIGTYESRDFLRLSAAYPTHDLVYINFERNIFSEWGLQRFAAGLDRVHSVTTLAEVSAYPRKAVWLFRSTDQFPAFISARPGRKFLPESVEKFRTKAHREVSFADVVIDPKGALALNQFTTTLPVLVEE